MAALIALLSGLLWGAADFGGGLASRRWRPVAVVAWSQAGGLVALLAVVAAVHPDPGHLRFLPWAALAASCGATGLVMFYRALAIGTMGVVSPIAATGGVVPVLVSVASGERPSAVQVAGMVAALAGAVAASGPELRIARSAQQQHRPGAARSVGLAAASGVMFGTATVAIARGSASGPLLTITSMRTCSVLAFALVALALRTTGGIAAADLTRVMPIGVVDACANLLFGIASTMGLVSVVSVLGALYPVSTVLLGRFVLGERLAPVQVAGVGLALGGVAALSAG